LKIARNKIAAIGLLLLPLVGIGVMCIPNEMAWEFLGYLAIAYAVLAIGCWWVVTIVNLWEGK